MANVYKIGSNIIRLGGGGGVWRPPTGGGGDLVHGQAAQATGSGFGSRVNDYLLFDDDSQSTIAAAGFANPYPNASGSGYNMAYRTPAALGRGVSLPHARRSKYMCGAHYNSTGASNGSNSGYDVKFDFDWNRSMGRKWFISTLFRFDPSWVINLDGFGGVGDNNTKYFYINTDAGFAAEPGIYVAYNNIEFTSPNDNGMASIWNTQGVTNYWSSPDNNGNNNFWNYAYSSPNSNPCNGWRRRTIWWKEASDTTGYYYETLDNRQTSAQFKFPAGSGNLLSSILRNKLILAYEGKTDNLAGATDHSFSFGGYGRSYGNTGADTAAQNNFRYNCDTFIQGGDFSRVELHDQSSYSGSTITVPQKVTGWSGTVVDYSCWGGELTNGPVYESVFDGNNVLVQTTARTLSG